MHSHLEQHKRVYRPSYANRRAEQLPWPRNALTLEQGTDGQTDRHQTVALRSPDVASMIDCTEFQLPNKSYSGRMTNHPLSPEMKCGRVHVTNFIRAIVDLEKNFVTAGRPPLRVVNKACRRSSFVDRTCDGRRPSMLYTHMYMLNPQSSPTTVDVAKCCQQSTTTSPVDHTQRQLCVQCDGRLGMTASRGPSVSAECSKHYI